jgi:hypothetical protein
VISDTEQQFIECLQQIKTLGEEKKLSDLGPRGYVHQGVYIGLGDRTCPVSYLCCILPAYGVELVDPEGNYSSCT